jgi:hypothetical protein
VPVGDKLETCPTMKPPALRGQQDAPPNFGGKKEHYQKKRLQLRGFLSN